MTPIENYTILRLWIRNTRIIPTVDNQTMLEIWRETFKQRLRKRIYQNLGVHTRFLPKKDIEGLVEHLLQQEPIEQLVLEIVSEQIKLKALELLRIRKKATEERERGATKTHVKNKLYKDMLIPNGKGALEVLTFPRRLTLKAAYTETIHLVRTIKKGDSYFHGAFDDQTPVHQLLTENELNQLADMLDRNESPAKIALALLHSRVNHHLARNNKKTISKRRLQDLLHNTPHIYRL